MKKLLLISAISLCAVSAWGQELKSTSQIPKKQATPSQVTIQEQREGAVQRGIRVGNPLQMINPFAPKEYGSGGEFVYNDEYDPFQRGHAGQPRAKGWKLFGFAF